MDLLARREHGRAELERKLSARGLDPHGITGALDRLESEGLLSDTRFAESFARSRAGRGQGPVRIRHDLGQRGISGQVVDLALEAVDVDWPNLAREVRRKRFGAEVPDGFRERARQARFLEGRGFTAEQSRSALGALDD
jgi:regulatory protein